MCYIHLTIWYCGHLSIITYSTLSFLQQYRVLFQGIHVSITINFDPFTKEWTCKKKWEWRHRPISNFEVFHESNQQHGILVCCTELNCLVMQVLLPCLHLPHRRLLSSGFLKGLVL
jgi:hypothetical protein